MSPVQDARRLSALARVVPEIPGCALRRRWKTGAQATPLGAGERVRAFPPARHGAGGFPHAFSFVSTPQMWVVSQFARVR